MENNLKNGRRPTKNIKMFSIPSIFRANISWCWLSSLRFFIIVLLYYYKCLNSDDDRFPEFKSFLVT
jgi:hypothetical protein